jgi:glycosyltransferase involved in cell wall biosynthesis
MKVLMISGDARILIPGTEVSARLAVQRAQVETLDVVVWPKVHSFRDVLKLSEKKGAYDVITSQDPFWRGLVAWYIARRIGAQLNLQVHTDLSSLSLFRRTLAHILLRRAHSVRVVSPKIRDYIATLGISAHISVLPIYINLVPFQSLVHTPHPRFEKTILWIGRFEREKDPLRALAILAYVRAQGISAGLILLGAGSLEPELREKARELEPYVEFPGWQNPLIYLAYADVVISTSLHESYGVSIIEALSAGVPVVSPDYGSAKSAGAIVEERPHLEDTVLRVLRSGEKGTLQMSVPTKEEWARQWRATLI